MSTIINPIEVKGIIDYDKLVNEFGTQLITTELIEKFERITKTKAHYWIKRGIFFSHRDLDIFLDKYAQGEMTCSEIKNIMIEKIVVIINEINNNKKNINYDKIKYL